MFRHDMHSHDGGDGADREALPLVDLAGRHARVALRAVLEEREVAC